MKKKTFHKISALSLAAMMSLSTVSTTAIGLSAKNSLNALSEEISTLATDAAGYSVLRAVTSAAVDGNKVDLTIETGEKIRFTFLEPHVFRMYMAPEGEDFQEYPTPNGSDHTATITNKTDDQYKAEYNVVPELTDDIGNDEFLDLIVDCFHSAIFGTVDENGEPHTNVIDIDFNENGRLIFATTNQKSFYRNLKRHNRVSITALRGRETLTSVGFTLQGYVDEISPSYLNKIFEIKPEMHHIYANKTEDFDTLRAFALTPVIGSVYDLREKKVFQKQFDFINQNKGVWEKTNP